MPQSKKTKKATAKKNEEKKATESEVPESQPLPEGVEVTQTQSEESVPLGRLSDQKREEQRQAELAEERRIGLERTAGRK